MISFKFYIESKSQLGVQHFGDGDKSERKRKRKITKDSTKEKKVTALMGKSINKKNENFTHPW